MSEPDPHGMFHCLLVRAENPEIQSLHVIIQQMCTIDGNNDRVTNKSILDFTFLSSTALVSKLLSLSG